ncbi:TonB-dependent receptor [Pseudoalteromonas sp. SG43-7]|uniref:TonB-dependent receptor n=1 Tax=Pseudoalteromonas TaxID=53246 RepID=UPI001602C3F6|nr:MULTISPECIES: TonB-dependent receptor [unclassified Pseudoalteromonas]MBB1340361.1 TonB-dependent receptor [Pseudoalteromonas sp. SR45-6]MBB1421442.1 TonB-dependent receptor [Pseudoalteromonas sp. SG43-7]MBB1433981.1 TonB-dependent receptor [Pseudoalteromonas sp. SG43-6]
MLRISSFLCVALSIFSIAADAATASLIEQLTDLSKRFSTAIIYNTSLLAGITVEPSTQTTLEQTLDLWLTPRQLSWQKTASGIVIFQTATSVPATAISILETNNTQVIEEVTVTESLPTPSNGDAYNHNYQQAINYAQQIKSNYVGQSEIAIGAMLNQLPAENLAEALQAVPGISITRDRGEALNINAMGLGAEYQLTLFNGHRLANTENVRNSNQYGQQHRFDIFSAGLFSNIAVYKTTNSSLPSGAVGATVNLLSDDPLAYQDNNLQVMLTTAALEGEQNLQPSFGLTGNAKTADGDLAVMVKMNYENRLQRQFQFETWHWGENGGAPQPYQWPDINKNILVPTDGLALTIENEDRTRATYYGALAWQATERLKLNTLWFRSDTDFSFDEHRISINPQSQSAQAQVNDENNSLNQFVFNDVNAKTSREESNLYYANQTIQVDANWQPSAHLPLTLSPFYSSSKANSKTKEPISRVHGAISPMQANVVLQNKSVDSFNFAGNLGLVSSYSHINQMSKRTINVLNEVDEWGIDSHWSRENYWGLQALDIGFLHSTQNYDYTRKDISLSPSALEQLPNLDGRWLEPITNKFSAEFINADVQPWLIPKSDLFQLYDIDLSFAEMSDSDRLNSYKVRFVSKEGYISSKWQFEQVTLSTGLRYSNTLSETKGSQHATTGELAPINSSNNDSTWLPSVNLKWQPSQFWQWRAGFSRSLNRPNYSDLNPKLHVNSGGLPYAELGNPNLQPVIANTSTLSVNWQQPSVSAQLLGFNHHMNNFIVEQAASFNYQGQHYNSLQRTNDGQAQVNGLQASSQWQLPQYSQWFLQSQLSASITHINKADVSTLAGNHLKVAGVSDWTGNLRFLVSDDKWQAAFNINYRSDFLEQHDISNNANSYVEGYTSTDLSFSWFYSANASLRLDLFNATNETLTRTAKTDGASSLLKAEEFGRRVVVSLSLRI